MIEWLNTYSSAINVIATITLVSVTGYYAWLTRRILLATEQQSKLSLDPVIGFEIEEKDGTLATTYTNFLGIPVNPSNDAFILVTDHCCILN